MRRFLWQAFVYSASAAVLKLAGFILFMWFAGTMSVGDYAVFGLLYAIQTGITAFSPAGIIEGVIGLLRVHRDALDRQALYGTATRLFAITAMAASVSAVAVLVATRGGAAVGLQTLAWVTVSGGLLAYAALQTQLVRLEEKHRDSLLFSFVVPVAGLLGGFVTFRLNRTASSFFAGSAIGIAVAIVLVARHGEGLRRLSGPSVSVRLLLGAAAPFAAVAFLGWLGGYGNNYIINAIYPKVEVARFTFALGLSSIMLLVGSALNQVWSPRFYRLTHEQPIDVVERKNRRFFGAQAAALGVLAGVTVAVFPAAMHLLGGNLVNYASMSVELALLMGSYVLQSPGWHCQNYYLAYGRGAAMMRVMVITSGIGIPTWLALMWWLGPIGIYVGFVVQILIRTTGLVVGARRHWAVTLSWEGVAAGLAATVAGLAAATHGFTR